MLSKYIRCPGVQVLCLYENENSSTAGAGVGCRAVYLQCVRGPLIQQHGRWPEEVEVERLHVARLH